MIVAAIATLGIVLPLTLGSSNTTVATPNAPTTLPGTLTGLSGSYYSPTVQDSSLLFLRLVQLQTALSGVLTVTKASPSHNRLIERRYQVTGTVDGPTFQVTIGVGTRAVEGTYTSGVLLITLADGTRISLHRGTIAAYRQLVVKDRAILIS